MKKLLLFLLLFAAGVSVLRWIEQPIATEGGGSRGLGAPDPVRASEIETPSDDSETPTGDDGGARLTVSGRTQIRGEFEDGPRQGEKRYELDARDSRSLPGGDIELIDVTATVYSEDDGLEAVRIVAGRGRATLSQSEDLVGGDLAVSDDFILSDVECTLLRRVPIAPVTLRAPELLGSLDAGHFSTDGSVEIDGRGLVASGTGFEMRADSGLIRFDRDGRASVDIEAGRRATLTSEKELTIRETEVGTVVVEAVENGRLELVGGDELELASSRILITGSSKGKGGEQGEGDLGFERIDAIGAVELRMQGAEFFAEEADITLADDLADRFRATLTGAPHGAVRFDESSATGEAFAINFRGAGPLVVERRERLGFTLPGPAEIDWRGARLTAESVVEGAFGPGEDEAELTARGDVVIVRADGALETGEFELRHTRDDDGASFVTASAAGPARMEGEADDDHTFVLTTDRTIDFVLDREIWRVPRTQGVELTVDGPRGFVAKADEVVDFSQEPLRFEARGDVTLNADDAALRGDRLRVRGPESMIVEGTPRMPAEFTSERGEWVAARVERDGRVTIADDVERASFSYEDGAYDLACTRLVVRELEEAIEAGMTIRGFEFDAEGDVRGSAQLLDDTLDLSSARLEGEHRRRLRGDVFLYSESAVRARGSVTSHFSRGENTFDLDSDELDLDHTDRGSEVVSSGALVARGNVEMRSTGESEITGTGDALEIDELGRGTLTADEGQRVSAVGKMPGDRYPFSMTATWIHFSDVFVDAADPQIELSYLRGGIDGSVASANATAEMLEARPGSVELSGNVRMQGVDETDSPWYLTADRATIDGAAVEGRGLFAGLKATGSIDFDLAGKLHAQGDEFAVRTTQQRIRIEGEPANIIYEGMRVTSDWIEYDLLVHLFRSGAAKIRPVAEGEGG